MTSEQPTYEYRVRFRDEVGQVRESIMYGMPVGWVPQYRRILSIERRQVGPWEKVEQ